MTEEKKIENHEFQAEISKLLHMMVHSVYSEKEIFLRELISNASDACDKLRYESQTNEGMLEGSADFRIEVSIDKEARRLVIADNGIGMSHDELIDNLGTIARSGTGKFVEQLTGDAKSDMSLIGQFGVGFYSAFMVADRVSVTSRRAGEDAVYRWESDGTGSFTLEPLDNRDGLIDGRGTRIELHMREGEDDFIEEARLRSIVKTYSDNIALPIQLLRDEGEPETLNSASALWTRSKSDITEEQYKEFYHHVGHQFDDPAMTIHYKAEGAIEYSVLLFAPSTRPFDLFDPARQNRVKLFVKRVYITDDAELLPPYLRFMRGLIDSEDMPLNLSREMLQNNPMVGKIRKAVTGRVIREMGKLADKEPEKFLPLWDAFGAVIKEGMYEDFERRDELMKMARFRTTKGEELRSLQQYVDDMVENQTAIYFITGDKLENLLNSPQLEGFKAKGVEVLLLTDPVDSFWTGTVEGFDGKPFKSVTRSGTDLSSIKSADGQDDDKPESDDSALDTLIAAIKQALGDRIADVRKSDRLTDSAVCLVASETGMDMHLEKIMAQHQQLDTGTGSKVLEINESHPLIVKLTARAKDGMSADLEEAAQLLLDQAVIMEGEQPEDPVAFARRMASLMEKGF